MNGEGSICKEEEGTFLFMGWNFVLFLKIFPVPSTTPNTWKVFDIFYWMGIYPVLSQ